MPRISHNVEEPARCGTGQSDGTREVRQVRDSAVAQKIEVIGNENQLLWGIRGGGAFNTMELARLQEIAALITAQLPDWTLVPSG